MATEANNSRGGFGYHCSPEQIQEFQKLSISQRLQWVEATNKFLNKFRPALSKEISEKFRRGDI